MRVSKYIKPHKDILLEYIYDDGNNIGEPYQILVNIKDNSFAYMSGSASGLANIQSNQLFPIDLVTNNYGLINTDNYSFLQVRPYASGFPLRHDVIKIHLPVNYTFGEYLGCYVRVYTLDYNNDKIYDLCNFFFDNTNVDQAYLLNYTSPPFLFQEKLWGKNLRIDIPSVYAMANQRVNGETKENTPNYNLTGGVGLSLNAPIFIEFSFITQKRTINSVTTYFLQTKYPMSLPQTPEFENVGVKIEHSKNGDFFEIYGTFNGNAGEFATFIEDAVRTGNRYYVEYNITIFEQNIRGKSFKIVVNDNFNEKVEFRPIIKFSTTTSIIDVEMNLIDAVDESAIYRRASYGMLQDEVSKYSLNLTKINIANANKPKIYNINSREGAGIFGNIPNLPDGGGRQIVLEPVRVDYLVFSERFNVVAKSQSVRVDPINFYGMGKLMLMIQPFDNVIEIIVAKDVSAETRSRLVTETFTAVEPATAPQYMDLTNAGTIQMVFKNTSITVECPLYTQSGKVDLANGVLAFRIPATKINDIRKVYDSGNNIFYIISTVPSGTTVIYSGLFMPFDARANIANLNATANQIQTQQGEQAFGAETPETATAIVTRRIIKSGSTGTQSGATSTTSNPSTVKITGVTYVIKSDSSLEIDGYAFSAQQIKSVLNLPDTPTVLTFKTDSLYTNDKLLDKLPLLKTKLENAFITSTELREVYQATQTNFRSNPT